MKSAKYVITFFILFSSFSLDAFTQSDSLRTEEYAIIDVQEQSHSNKKSIQVTIGEKPYDISQWNSEHINKKRRFYMVTFIMGKLNEMGFEVVNMSTSYKPHEGTSTDRGEARHTILMVRKFRK